MKADSKLPQYSESAVREVMPADGEEQTDLGHSFAKYLNAELDRIGFPQPPFRNTELGSVLGLQKPQCYRILKGLSFPTWEGALKLRAIGVDWNKLLDNMIDTRPRVAIVDDEVGQRAALTLEMGELFQVYAFGNRTDFDAALKSRPFDGYILDWALPRGGEDLVRHARQHSAPKTPILLLSGKATSAEAIQMIQRYNVMYFEKGNAQSVIATQLLAAIANR